MSRLAPYQAEKRGDARDSIEPISMRVPDACRFTGISRSTLYLLIAQGEVEIIKLGNSTLVLTESLRRMVERRRTVVGNAARGNAPE